MNLPNHERLPEHEATDTDPETMDFPALAHRVTVDVEDLVERALNVDTDLAELAIDPGPDQSAAAPAGEAVPSSPDELLAQLNGIAAIAYRLARCVRPLTEARARQLDGRVGRERR